jgi:hypothetical protein
LCCYLNKNLIVSNRPVISTYIFRNAGIKTP